MAEVCLSLLGAPALEEKLLDVLLMHPSIATFVSQRAASHGGHPDALNASEQVQGRGDAVLVQALLEDTEAETLLSDLRRGLSGSGLRYWLTPVLGEGEL